MHALPSRRQSITLTRSQQVWESNGPSPGAQVRWWDVTTGEQVCRLTEHTDYVRAGAVCPLDSNIWATGAAPSPCLGTIHGYVAL